MNACPCGGIRGECAVVVAARVIDIPAKVRGSEALLVQPFGHGKPVERRGLRARFHGDGELSGCSKLIDTRSKPREIFAISGSRAHNRLDALLPSAVQI